MIEGLSHLTFIVRDLERMSRLIVDVLGGREVYSSGDATFSIAREKFFVAGGLWIAIMEGEPLPSAPIITLLSRCASRISTSLSIK